MFSFPLWGTGVQKAVPMPCGHQKTVQGTNACWQYCAGFLWDWRKETAKRRTNAEVKSEQQESVRIPFIKERSEVSMDERAFSHSSLWSCHLESQWQNWLWMMEKRAQICSTVYRPVKCSARTRRIKNSP